MCRKSNSAFGVSHHIPPKLIVLFHILDLLLVIGWPSFLYFLVKKTANTNEIAVDSWSEAAENASGVGRVRVL